LFPDFFSVLKLSQQIWTTQKDIFPNLGRGWEVFIVNQDFELTFETKDFGFICFQMDKINGTGCIKLH
jgi:hypothetical protein